MTDMPDAEVFHVPDFIDKLVAQEWYNELLMLDTCKFMPELCSLKSLLNVVRVYTNAKGLWTGGHSVQENRQSVALFPLVEIRRVDGRNIQQRMRLIPI